MSETSPGDFDPQPLTRETLRMLVDPFKSALETSSIDGDLLISQAKQHRALRKIHSIVQKVGLLSEIHLRNVIYSTSPPDDWSSSSVHDLLSLGTAIPTLRLNRHGSIIGSGDTSSYPEIDAGIILTHRGDVHTRQIPLTAELKISRNSSEIKKAMNIHQMNYVLGPLRTFCNTEDGVYMLVVGQDGIPATNESVRNFESRGGVYVVLPTTQAELAEIAQSL